eukprot:CAMPEP_0171763962 /NCGR_PEP_ID=MMETSP0991-20121206/49665_1 /TAXON_ID=483369 /ORGANISM="non described non described, Strain CCMP2098" /LENGTH=84 /DNA_ID=CAMNT_0012367919 /DNA_START=277 /DNA_END=531 /DNA_ORIENTATION=-
MGQGGYWCEIKLAMDVCGLNVVADANFSHGLVRPIHKRDKRVAVEACALGLYDFHDTPDVVILAAYIANAVGVPKSAPAGANVA